MEGTIYTVPVKPWWKSMTVWANVAAFLVGVIGIVMDMQDVLDLPEQWAVYLTLLTAVLNFALRFRTTQPVDSSADVSHKHLKLTGDDGSAKAIDGGHHG
jgi:hypothetical protein